MVRRLPAHILEYGQAEQREFPNKLAVSISPFYKFEVPTCVLVPSTCRVVPSSLVNSPWAPSQTNPKVWLTNHFNPRELVVKASPQNVHYSAAPSASLALIWFGQGGLWPRLYDSSSLKHVFLSWAWGSLFQASFSLKSVLKPCLKTIVLPQSHPSSCHLPPGTQRASNADFLDSSGLQGSWSTQHPEHTCVEVLFQTWAHI